MDSKEGLTQSQKVYKEDINDEVDTNAEEENIKSNKTSNINKVEETPDSSNTGKVVREYLSKDQWEEEVELYRAYLLNLSNRKEPDIYRLTSEITTSGTLTFRIYKKEIKNYYFESKLHFEDAFILFGYIPGRHFQSLSALYTRVIEFLIQEMKFKLKEPILEKSNSAIIQIENNKIVPNKLCTIELKKIFVKEKKLEDNIKNYLTEIDRKLSYLKLQNRIFLKWKMDPEETEIFIIILKSLMK